MLEVSRSLQLSPSSKQQAPPDHHQRGFDVEFIPTSAAADCCDPDDFMVNDSLLLDYIDFSCCDVPSFIFDTDGDDILPDLEVDPTDQLLAEFSSPPELQDAARLLELGLGDDDDEAKLPPATDVMIVQDDKGQQREVLLVKDDKKKHGGDEQATTTDDGAAGSSDTKSSAGAHSHSKKKPSAATGKNSNGGKRKVKVDWTPELHRRFVQAVEQLGIDKAVPSRILDIMGIECLTRHNIASHLQKYRSHRKHLMAREAEAATWAQKRHMYAAAAMAQPPPPFCRPLHVWGHPPTPTAVEAAAPPTMLPVWPRHLAPPRPWAPVDPAAAAYWQQQYHHNASARKWGGGPQHHHHQAPAPAVVTQGTPCVVPPAAMLPRFPLPAVLPHPHPTMYTTRPATATTMVVPPPPLTSKLAELQLHQLDAHPSKESIDAAIGDVLVKPWLPLPLGLKPPSLDSVMSELHKQGIPKIPPAGQQQRG